MGIDFVFLDERSRPYYCKTWGDELWLFFWHTEQRWVSLRPVTEEELKRFPENLTEREQQMYHDLHAGHPPNKRVNAELTTGSNGHDSAIFEP